MKIYKDTYLLKNEETQEVLFRGEQFNEALDHCSSIILDFRNLLVGIVPNGYVHLPTIKQYIADKKAIYENVVIFRPYTGDAKSRVWGFLNGGFKHAFAESRPYFNNFQESIRTLYFRLGSSLGDKAFVKINGHAGLEKIQELAVQYVEATHYDKHFQKYDMIISMEQLNLILLTQEKENPTIASYVEFDEMHQDFVNNGLI